MCEDASSTKIILSFIILSILGSAATYIFCGSRILAHAACLNYIPIFSDKLRWDFKETKERTPKNALITQFMWCSLLIILIEGGMSFDVYGSFSNLSWYSECLFYLSAGFVLLYLRHKHDKINKKNTGENPAVGGATVGGTDCERGHTTNLAV